MERVFEKILNSQKDNQLYFKNVLKSACEFNKVSLTAFSKISPKIIQKNLKYLKRVNQQNSKIWIENQLIIFRFTIVIYSWENKKKIENYELEEWNQLSEMFRNKQIYILKYQAKNLLMIGRNTRRSWKQDQQDLLIQLKNRFQDENRWNEIARLLYLKSDYQYFRLGKHCRQHWLTYLDPKINNPVLKEENNFTVIDQNIFKLLHKHGKKWTLICEQLSLQISPSQLKNKLNSLLKNVQEQNGFQTVQESIQYLIQKLDNKKTNKILQIQIQNQIQQPQKVTVLTSKQSQNQYQEQKYFHEPKQIQIKQKQKYKSSFNSGFSAFRKIEEQEIQKNLINYMYESQFFTFLYFNEWLHLQLFNYSNLNIQNIQQQKVIKQQVNIFQPYIIIKR